MIKLFESSYFSGIFLFVIYSLPWVLAGKVEGKGGVAGLIILIGGLAFIAIRSTPGKSLVSALSQLRKYPILFGALIGWFFLGGLVFSFMNYELPDERFRSVWFVLIFAFSTTFQSVRWWERKKGI